MPELQTIEDRMRRLRNEPLQEESAAKVTQPAVSDDPLAARVLRLRDPEIGEAQKNIDATRDIDPDKAAENYRLSKESGFSLSTVNNVPDEVSNYLSMPTLEADDTEMVAVLGRDMTAAAIMRDDTGELREVKSTWQKTRQAFEEGDIDQKINILITRRELLGFDPEGVNKQILELESRKSEIEPFTAEGFIEKVATATARQIPQQLSSLEQALGRAVEGGAIGSAGALLAGPASPVTVPAGFFSGMGAGFKFGQIEGIFYQEFGGAFREFSEIRDEQNRPINPTVAKVMAFGVGSVNAVFEFASFKALVKTFPGGEIILAHMTPDFIRKTTASAAIRERLKQIAVNAGKSWTTEVATEVLQESVTVIVGEMAKELQKKLTGAEFKDFDVDVFIDRLQEIATETMYSAFGFILPGTAASTAKTVADSVVSKDFHNNNDNMKTAVDATKTQQRSPDHSEQFIEQLQTEPVYMSPEGVDRLYQESTPEEADAILTKVGVNPQEAKQVAAAGQDVEFKQSKQLAQLTTEEYNKIKDDVKPAPGAYTRREINDQKDKEDVAATVKLLAQKAEAEKKISAEVTRLSEESVKAGVDPELSEDAPILLKGLADRLTLNGIDPIKFLSDISIKKTRFTPIKEFFQPGIKKPRGALTLENERKTIELFENADMSTVFHEIGHIALLEYTDIERVGEASKELKQDINALRKWAGVKEGADFTREQSEQVARGFEAYLMEGKAPTTELRTAFERIKEVMISIYKTVKKLDVKLNKQVRGVFDRMLSANLEVEAAAQSGGFTIQTKEEMDNLGMVKEDRVFAGRLIEQTKRKAESNLTRARNKGLRSLRKNWREESRAETRTENKIYNVVDTILLNAGRFNLDELEIIRAEIEEGEAPQRLPVRDKDGDIIKWIGIPSTFPEYFKDRKLKKKDTLKVIDKAIKGEIALTDLQRATIELLTEGYRDQTARLIESMGGNLDDLGLSEDFFLAGETRLDRDEFIVRYGADQIDNLLNPAVLVKDGAPIDQIAITFGYEEADVFVEEMLTTPPFNEAAQQRYNQKQAEHDASFVVEDFIVDLPEYRSYLELVSRYVNGKRAADQQAIDTGIQRNIKRWKKEATKEITSEQPLLTGAERDREIQLRVQDKVDRFTQQKAKPTTITTDTLKRLARETMNAKKVREARRVDKFMAAAKKASSDGRRAILKENWGEASRQGEIERFNYEMASLSGKVRGEVAAFEARAKKAGNQKSLGAEYREAILHLINRFNIAPMVPRKPQEVPNYSSLFASDDFSAGYEAPSFITDGTVLDYRDLRVGQLRDLDSAIRFLKKHGDPQDKNLTKDGDRIQEDIVEPIVKKGESVKVKKVYQQGSMMRKLTDFTRPKFARLDSLNFTAIAIDGYTNLGKNPAKGLFEKFVIDALKASNNLRTEIKKEIDIRLRPHIAQLGKTLRRWRKERGHFFEVDGAPVPARLVADGQYTGWRPDQIMAMMLNLGNDSNIARLFNGYPDLTGDHVGKLMDLLSREDWQAIQGIWDTMESLFSETNQVHLRMEGYDIPKIEARPLRTKFGVLRGGYYPAKYDGTLDFNTAARDEIETTLNNEESRFTVPYAKKNHTQMRTEKAGDLPIFLDLSVINKHFETAIHYIAYAETIRDSSRIINNTISVEQHGKSVRVQPIKDLVVRILGKDVSDSMIPSLRHIANPNYVGYDQPSGKKWISIGRSLSTAYILAWNTGVALKQPLSTFGAIHDLGGGLEGFSKYINGFFSVLSSPSAHYQMMLDLSEYMGDRMSNFDRELRKTFQKLTSEQKAVYWGDKAVTWDDVVSFGFWQIRLADTVTVMPIWHGAFADKLNDAQTNVQEAVNHADDIVRNSQPSAQALDLSSWQRDAGVFRLFSQFQTFTVGKYGQRQRLYYRAWRNKSISITEYAWFNFMDAFMPLTAINFMLGVIHGQDFKDPEEQKEILFKIFSGWITMGVPIVNNLISAFDFGSPFDSPVLKTAEKLWKSTLTGLRGLDGFDNKKEREAALWGIARALSILMRIPLDKVVSRAIRGAKSKKSLAGIDWLIPPPPKKKKK